MSAIELPPYTSSDLRETPVATADTWTAVDDRADATGLANIRPAGRRLMALVIVAAGGSDTLGATTGCVRVSGAGKGVHYFPFPVGGGQLITGAGWQGTDMAYIFPQGLETADELVVEAAQIGVELGMHVTVSFYFA